MNPAEPTRQIKTGKSKNTQISNVLKLLARVLAGLGTSRLLGEEVWDRSWLDNAIPRKEVDWKLTLVDVGENTTLGDGDVSKKLVQLLIVPDGELEMTGNDTGLLVVTSGVTGQLEDFGSEVLKDGCEVDGSTSTDTLGVVALAEKTVDTTNGESETGLGGTAVKGM